MDHQHPAVSAEELSHSFEEPPPEADLSVYAFEDWITFAMFWGLCLIVFYQFFTRYALNSSAAWTEEIARYFLVSVVFLGSSMCVRQNHHIQVDILYRYLPKKAGRVLATVVDLLRAGFLAYAAWLTWQVMEKVGSQSMTMIDWPMSVVYTFVLGGFVFMCLRAVLLMIGHLRRGTSILETPETLEG